MHELLTGGRPEHNIPIAPQDVITVPPAEMVYVLGHVRKPGAFTLKEKESMSVLQAIALAEGLERTASSKNAKLVRPAGDGRPANELPVDIQSILRGKQPNVPMQPNDILVIPDSMSKKVAVRTLEAVVQAGTGIVIWRR